LLGTKESGDEPMLLALALPGVPVLVGKDRRITAALAVEKFSPDLLLLDDGFQYWQLYRDVDLVLLDADRPFENGHCLPRGTLREPKQNLRRAQMVLLTRSSHLNDEQKAELLTNVSALAPNARVFCSDHVAGACALANSAAQQIGSPTAPLAICAIARPESFLETLSDAGIEPLATMILPDHYHYKASDRSKIVGKMKKSHAATVVTTQKDFVKLKGVIPDIPIFVQQVEMKFDEPSDIISHILSKLGLPATLVERVETC
jgi:tetraacyldisaccharide 4'-kinase